MSQLYGKQLANQIPATTTGNQARLAFGAMTENLHGAYQTLADYTDAQATGSHEVATFRAVVDADAIAAARQYLDSTNDMLGRYFPDMPATDEALSAQQLAELKAAASICSVACMTIDDLFQTSWLASLVDAVIEATATVVGKVANAVSKVAGSFLGGTWWIWGGALLLVLVFRKEVNLLLKAAR